MTKNSENGDIANKNIIYGRTLFLPNRSMSDLTLIYSDIYTDVQNYWTNQGIRWVGDYSGVDYTNKHNN